MRALLSGSVIVMRMPRTPLGFDIADEQKITLSSFSNPNGDWGYLSGRIGSK